MQVFPTDRRAWLRLGMRLGALFGTGALGVLALGLYLSSAPGTSHAGPLPPATPDHVTAADRLRADVQHLAGVIGPRDMTHPKALVAAREHVVAGLAAAGHAPVRMPYAVNGVEVQNLEATLPGRTRPDEIILVGAHYDCVETTPGADDNASGVAVMLEIARRLRDRPLARTVRFVAFVNEEPPYFKTDQMGSLVYARAARARGDRVVAMFSLEMLGYYVDAAGSQQYPPFLSALYPDRGDFVAFVGDFGARPLVQRAVGLFRDAASFPAEALSGPASIPGVDFSDHWSFWQAGYTEAIMVTDTAFMRNHAYHEPEDTPARLDYDRMARVTLGLTEVVARLADAGP